MPRVKKNYKSKQLIKMVKTVGNMVTLYREKAGLSQNQLSKNSKVAISTINEIENHNVNDLRLSTIDTLARYLKVTPLELIYGSTLKVKDQDTAKFKRAMKILSEIDKKIV